MDASGMAVIGDKYSVELGRRKTHGADWTVLKLIGNDGTERGCRWHADAADREIAFALRRFADQIDPPKIQPPLRGASALRTTKNWSIKWT